MYAPAKIVLRSYIPTFITVGMYFKTTKSYIQYGNETPIEQLWVCEVNVDVEETDEFIARYGAPVEPVIVVITDENPDNPVKVMTTPEQLGWIEYEDKLFPIELKDLNYLLSEFGGHVGLYMSDEDEDAVHLEEGMVVICPIDNLYEEYDEDFE